MIYYACRVTQVAEFANRVCHLNRQLRRKASAEASQSIPAIERRYSRIRLLLIAGGSLHPPGRARPAPGPGRGCDVEDSAGQSQIGIIQRAIIIDHEGVCEGFEPDTAGVGILWALERRSRHDRVLQIASATAGVQEPPPAHLSGHGSS